jgi:chemotaxis protein histidine kinase CheA
MAGAKGTKKGSDGGKEKGQKDSTSKPGPVEAEIDQLYRLPLPEFTGARNTLATQLKKAGRADEADLVKGLAKPPMTAWAVNQLYWTKREAFDRLMGAGEKFRRAQASQLAGKSTDLRGPLEARRTALAELSTLAAAAVKQAGGSTTPDNMRRIMTTLEALATYGDHPDGPRPGRLADDLDPPGFETLAALVPRVGGSGQASGPTRVIPFQQAAKTRPSRRKLSSEEEEQRREEERKARVTAAKDAVETALSALRDAREEAHQAEEDLKKAAAHAKEKEKEKADAEERFEKAAAEAEDARLKARTVAAKAEEAAQAVEDSERALERAERELKELET